MTYQTTQKVCPILEPHSPHDWIEAVQPVNPVLNEIEFHTCIPTSEPIGASKVDFLLFRAMSMSNWRRHLQGPEGGLGNPDAGEPGPTLFAQTTLALAQAQIQKRLTQHQVRSHIQSLQHYIDASNDAQYGTLSTVLVSDYLKLIERALFPHGILEQDIP